LARHFRAFLSAHFLRFCVVFAKQKAIQNMARNALASSPKGGGWNAQFSSEKTLWKRTLPPLV
jgi:hypothetical protein